MPARPEDLVTLPGVGRKTANVVLGNAFGVPGITVDTHFGRLVRRFGWTEETDPVKVEHAIGALFPKRDWTMLSHHLIWHGRRRCHAAQAGLRRVPARPAVPGVRRGADRPGRGGEAGQDRGPGMRRARGAGAALPAACCAALTACAGGGDGSSGPGRARVDVDTPQLREARAAAGVADCAPGARRPGGRRPART